MSTLKNKAINGALWSIIDKVINQIGNFLVLIYLSRELSASDFGLIAMLTIFLAISQSLIDSGFSQALIQRSTEVKEIELSTVFYINLCFSFILYLSLYSAAPIISDFYNQPDLITLSRVLFVVIIINSLSIVPKAILTISVDFKSQSIANSTSMLVGGIIAIYMVSNNYGYWALVGMNIGKSIANVIAINCLTKWYPKLVFSYDSIKKLFSFGSYLLIAGLLATTVRNLYNVLIGRYFSSAEVGYYQQGYNYTDILSGTISSIIQGVTYPIMTSIKNDEARLIDIYSKVMGVVTLVTFPIFFGFIAIADEFVEIFLGEKWQAIIPILTTLSLARMITPISVLNLNILNAKGRSDLYFKADIIKLPITFFLLIVAVPYGIEAVAWAQVFFVIISFFINAYYPGKLFGFGWYEQVKVILPTLFASILMLVVISQISMESIVFQLLAKIVVGIAFYIIACRIMKIESFIYILKSILVKVNKK